MIQEVLDCILTEEQREAGLHLTELDDHILALMGEDGSCLATWSSVGVTVVEIQREAERWNG